MLTSDGLSMIMQRQEKVNCRDGGQRSANSGETWVWLFERLTPAISRVATTPQPHKFSMRVTLIPVGCIAMLDFAIEGGCQINCVSELSPNMGNRPS